MLRTRSGLPKHCSWNEDRHGKRRVRFRLRGFSTYLTGTPWSEDFMRQYAAALDGVKLQAQEVGASRTKAGSIDALCVSYYRAPEFRDLKASTQKVRRNIIERFRQDYGGQLLKGLRRRHIVDIIGARAKTPEAANNLLKVLKVVFDYAVSLEMIDNNPAVGVKGYRSRSDGFQVWTETEVAQFAARHPVKSRAGLALALLLYTMQRVSDVVRMGWQHVTVDDEGNSWLRVEQQKTGTRLQIPMHPELEAALAAVPRTNMTFLMSERGAPLTANGFGNWFGKQCDLAGLPGLTAHGLRKLGLTLLANALCTNEQIKAFGGHQSDRALASYLRSANQQILARQALAQMLRSSAPQALTVGAEGEQKIVQPRTPVGQNRA